MPDWVYDFTYDDRIDIHNNEAVLAPTNLVSVNGIVVQTDGSSIIEGLAACSRYHVEVDVDIYFNTTAQYVELSLYAGDFVGRIVIGRINLVPFGSANNPAGRQRFNLRGDIATPSAYRAYYLMVDPEVTGSVVSISSGLARPTIYLGYLGSSVDCTDIIIHPPPPFGVWCEPFVPVTDQDIEDLIDAHFERTAALADGTWNVT